MLRRINLLIGAVLVCAGIAGGFLLTFWFLLLLLPITCVASSWIMAWTAVRAREGHSVMAIILTAVFAVWFAYFLQNGTEMPTWYGIFTMWTLLIVQAAIFVSANRQVNSAEAIDG
jgi:hypothetical protein